MVTLDGLGRGEILTPLLFGRIAQYWIGRFTSLLDGYEFNLLSGSSRISIFCVGVFLCHFLLLCELSLYFTSKLVLHLPLPGFFYLHV